LNYSYQLLSFTLLSVAIEATKSTERNALLSVNVEGNLLAVFKAQEKKPNLLCYLICTLEC